VAELVDHPGPTASPAVPTLPALPATTPAEPDSARPVAAPASAEIRLLAAVQQRVGGRAVGVARGMSLFGEHAGGWLVLGVLGAVVNPSRRREWLTAAAGVALAHGASIGVKRVVRRRRPDHPSVEVRVGTPSRLSFPSAHATSTTAAAVLYGRLLRRPLVPVLVPPMALSRLVLGVHYPSDVVVGSALGAVVALAVRRVTRRRPNPEGR
jgi:membrane-associated phospholipid phosphatase